MKILIIAATLLFPGPQQTSDSTCSVRAVVVDSNSQKVAGAFVQALPLQGRSPSHLPGGKSKEDGSILIEGLAPGKYRFYVWKESAGVPYTRGVIYQRAEDHYAEFQVGPGSANAAPIVLQLPAPYGAATVHISDSDGGGLVPAARIRLETVGQAQSWIDTNPAPDGTYVIQLPERATTLKITAPGYETWTYPGYLVLQSGTSQSIDVKLVRKPLPAQVP